MHVGQDDISVARCREILGPDAIIGLSTHAPDEFAAAMKEPVDYRSAGPIVPTPTKEGRPGTGVDYAAECHALSDGSFDITSGALRHAWTFDGGATIAASPAPSVVPAPWSNPALVDPEEAFVASVASCRSV